MFDKVFKPNASQDKVYGDAAKSIVSGNNYLNILNTWLFIYNSLLPIHNVSEKYANWFSTAICGGRVISSLVGHDF